MREYETVGVASPKKARVAGWIDAAAAIGIAVIAFPFPIIRASTTTLVFVASMLVAVIAVHYCYLGLTATFLGRTPGMYLMDLGFEGGHPAVFRVWLWALGAVLVAGPHPEKGLGARFSGLRVMSTRD